MPPRRSAWSAGGRSTAASTSTAPQTVIAGRPARRHRTRRPRLHPVGGPRRGVDRRRSGRCAQSPARTGSVVPGVEGDRRAVRAGGSVTGDGCRHDPAAPGVGPGGHPARRTDRGPGPGRAVPALVGNGAALVDTTYIDGAASARWWLHSIAAKPNAVCNGRAYVIANGEPRPIKELVLGICAAAGVDLIRVEVPRRVALFAGSDGRPRVAPAWRRMTSRHSPASSPSSSGRRTGSTRVRLATTSGGRRRCRSTRASCASPSGSPSIRSHDRMPRFEQAPLSSAANWRRGRVV